MKRIIVLLCLLIGTSSLATLSAQIRNPNGYVINRTGLGVTEMIDMSQYSSAFGTARSTAMGGAFTALGADVYSMHLNPAGLGLYRGSEFSITPAFTINKMESKMGGMSSSENRNRFAFNNIGAAFNVYQSSRGITSVTIGASYNKLADFNYRSSTPVFSGGSFSIAEVFQHQLNAIGNYSNGVQTSRIRPEDLQGNTPWRNRDIFLEEWGAVLAYKTFLLDPRSQDALGDLYSIYGFGPGTGKGYLLGTKSKGSIGEYAFSGAINVNNKLYVGLTIGIQDIYLRQSVDYNEFYDNDPNIDPADKIDQMFYGQDMRLSGSGVNFKLGVIYRPIPELRLGLAFHSPTYVNLDKEYAAGMVTLFQNTPAPTPENPSPVNYEESSSLLAETSHKFNTPTRLMLGVAYSFGNYGIISFDYERAWIDNIKIRGASAGTRDYYKQIFKNDFNGSNIFRAGAEFRPTHIMAVRAGFTYADSFLENDRSIFDAPIGYKSYTVSAGLGFRLGATTSLDLSYVFGNTKYTDYDLFYFEYMADAQNWASTANPASGDTPLPSIRQQLNRHNIMATFSVRF